MSAAEDVLDDRPANSIERSWAVMSWNVHGTKQPDPEALADAIRVESPDVVAVQEIRSGTAEALAAALEMDFVWDLKHYPYGPLLRWAAEGLAIFTPHELVGPGHRVISDSSSTWTYQRRIVQWGVVRRDDTSGYRIYNTHLTPGNRADERLDEADRIATLVHQHGDAPPAVVAGDFNDGTDPSIIATLPGIETITPSFTNPAAKPTQLLDHVLVPADAERVSVAVPAGGADWAKLSDHLPVTVRFTMNWVAGDFT